MDPTTKIASGETNDFWPQEQTQLTVLVCRDLVHRALELPLELFDNKTAFRTADKKSACRKGINAAEGRLVESQHVPGKTVVTLQLEMLRCDRKACSHLESFARHLNNIGEERHSQFFYLPSEQYGGHFSIWARLEVAPTAMSPARIEGLLSEIRRLDAIAGQMQDELPCTVTDARLEKRYQPFLEWLELIQIPGSEDTYPQQAKAWTSEMLRYLHGNLHVAVTSPYPLATEMALSALAGELRSYGDSLGILTTPDASVKSIVENARKAPGRIVVPAAAIGFSSNAYDSSREISSLLAVLTALGKPVLFSGQLEQLQSVFHGGQGAANNPLSPVVCHVPDFTAEQMARYAIEKAGRMHGGLPAKAVSRLSRQLLDGFGEMPVAEQKQTMEIGAHSLVRQWLRKEPALEEGVRHLSALLGNASETLSGLSPHPRVRRSPQVQQRFLGRLTDYRLLCRLQSQLLAQEEALRQLIRRAETEILTRPPHQPLRWLLQGTPGCGKSESTRLIAEWLEVPYVYIDAASFGDYHTATSQLLGSPRGYVGSYQAGRLEQIAKHHTGVVVEFADPDHAPFSVRSMLGSLFLQLFETGEAQSAMGSVFSCANILFVVTMNLPGGGDEQVRKGIGFGQGPDATEVRRRVSREIKHMFSSALLSRMGTPILFQPLDGPTLTVILERAIDEALRAALQNSGLEPGHMVREPGIGAQALHLLKTDLTAFGARTLLEHGRQMAADAFLQYLRTYRPCGRVDLYLSIGSDSRLRLQPLVAPVSENGNTLQTGPSFTSVFPEE